MIDMPRRPWEQFLDSAVVSYDSTLVIIFCGLQMGMRASVERNVSDHIVQTQEDGTHSINLVTVFNNIRTTD